MSMAACIHPGDPLVCGAVTSLHCKIANGEQSARCSAGSAGAAITRTLGVRHVRLGSFASVWPDHGDFRGRDASYLAPPAQIRTGPIRAYGSHLGCLTAKQLAGHG